MPKIQSSSGFIGFTGFLDDILARMRCRIAGGLIPEEIRAGSVLDIGCGTYPLFLSKSSFLVRVGLDRVIAEEYRGEFAPKGICLVRHDLSESGGRLPFGSESFDAVVMLAVIEHLTAGELAALLAETNRILRPGGICILTTPAPRAMSLLTLMSRIGLLTPESIDEHKESYCPAKARAMLLAAGFPEDGVSAGHFELFMNVWARGRKRLTRKGSIG
jgi:SAM-dependent methyltransferase